MPKLKPEPNPRLRREATINGTPKTKSGPKPKGKSEVNAKPKPEAKTPLDLTSQIATRAYELYEQQGHRDGRSVQNWNRAEREIQKDQAKPEPNPEAKPEPESEAQS
jgi:H+-transporting ATPase